MFNCVWNSVRIGVFNYVLVLGLSFYYRCSSIVWPGITDITGIGVQGIAVWRIAVILYLLNCDNIEN